MADASRGGDTPTAVRALPRFGVGGPPWIGREGRSPSLCWQSAGARSASLGCHAVHGGISRAECAVVGRWGRYAVSGQRRRTIPNDYRARRRWCRPSRRDARQCPRRRHAADRHSSTGTVCLQPKVRRERFGSRPVIPVVGVSAPAVYMARSANPVSRVNRMGPHSFRHPSICQPASRLQQHS